NPARSISTRAGNPNSSVALRSILRLCSAVAIHIGGSPGTGLRAFLRGGLLAGYRLNLKQPKLASAVQVQVPRPARKPPPPNEQLAAPPASISHALMALVPLDMVVVTHLGFQAHLPHGMLPLRTVPRPFLPIPVHGQKMGVLMD